MGIAAIWGVMTGCKPASVGLGPFPATAPAHPAGLRYSLGRDLVVIEAVVSEYVETRIVSADGKQLKEVTETGVVPVKAEISLKTTADPFFVYVLDLSARGLSHGSLDIRVGDNGLLASVEAEARSRAGDMLLHVARVAGEVAGAVAGFRGTEAFNPGEIASDPAEPGANTASAGASGRRERRLESLSFEALYFLQESASARELWRDVDRLEEELVERRASLRVHTDSAAGAADTARFSLAEKRAGFVEESIQFLEKQSEKARKSFSESLRNFLAAKKIGREARDRTIRRHLEIPDLPPSAAVFGAISPEAVVSALENAFPRALALYRETGLVVAFDPAIALPDTPAPETSLKPNKNEVRIYFRETVPGFLRIYCWEEGLDPETKEFGRMFRPADEKPVCVLHPNLPVRSVGLDRKAFSSRSLRLAVNGQGRVVGLSASSTPSSAEAAAGAASALAAFRQVVAETWGDVRALVEALGKMSRGEIEARLALFKLEAEKLKRDPDT